MCQDGGVQTKSRFITFDAQRGAGGTDLVAGHPNSLHFHGLDGLRGIAAIAVLVLHGMYIMGFKYSPHAAGLAVDFFFMLSGFVIAYAYDAKLMQNMQWRSFMTLRVCRLYPMIFAGMVLGAAAFGVTSIEGAAVIVASFALLPAGLLTPGFGKEAYPVNNPAWSLFFEIAVNAVYATRLGRVGITSLVALIGVSAICLVGAAYSFHDPFRHIGFLGKYGFVLGFARVSYPFWMGVLLFRVGIFERVPKLPIEAIAAFLLLILLAPFGGKVYSLSMILFVFPAIVALGSCATFWSGTLVSTALGELSYPIYLVHEPIFQLVHHTHLPKTEAFVTAFVVSVAVAQGLLIVYDRPVRRWLRARIQ